MAIVAQRLLLQYSLPRSQWPRESTPQFSMLAITQTATKSKVNSSFLPTDVKSTSNPPACVKSAQLIPSYSLWKPGITIKAGTTCVIDVVAFPPVPPATLYTPVFLNMTLS